MIQTAPSWCSVDLRDGNQALEVPMNLDQKLELFKFLVGLGFKEIEVGFPAASDTEYVFTRTLIEQNLIPEDVTIQVLTQARDHIIERTFESLIGVKKAVVHLYNSTSTLQRDVVFHMEKIQIVELAVNAAKKVKELAEENGKERFTFQYSPESFTGTELDFSAEICNAVLDVWEPAIGNEVIINLPATVEMSMPNIYADQIEYMCDHLKYREHILVSVHTHNDRGTAVAATEFGLLAGADRVEGTLFGNGERTGNADIVTLALNMNSQGIETGLDFAHIDEVIHMYEKSTDLPVHPRHPYAGNLVFTAFSGSHQDAINKGMARMKENTDIWAVPYLPIDPMDVGRNYDPIIRINSQSGKGGVAFILEQNYGLQIPKTMQQDFSLVVNKVSDSENKELLPEEIYELFKTTYINIENPISLVKYVEETQENTFVRSVILLNGSEESISGHGSGIMDGFCKGLIEKLDKKFDITSYSEHSLEYGATSRAITYVKINDEVGKSYFGAGVSSNIVESSLKAIVSAVNNML